MSVRPCDEFGSDLFKSGFENGLSLDSFLAQDLIDEIDKGGRHPSYQAACDAALDKYLVQGKAREAYTNFLGRVFGRRRREKYKQWRERPFAPPDQNQAAR